MVFVATAQSSPLPVVGASGAVSGVMAASLVLWPSARLKTPSILLLFFILGLLYELLVAIGVPSLLLGGPVFFIIGVISVVLMTRGAGSFFAGLISMVELPTWLVLGLYLGMQLFSGMLAVVNPAFAGAVGYWAHIGGLWRRGAARLAVPQAPEAPGKTGPAGIARWPERCTAPTVAPSSISRSGL